MPEEIKLSDAVIKARKARQEANKPVTLRGASAGGVAVQPDTIVRPTAGVSSNIRLRGASEAGKPVQPDTLITPIRQVKPAVIEPAVNRLPSQRASAEVPIMTKGVPVKAPSQVDDKQKQIELMVKSAKGEQFNDDDLKYMAEKQLAAEDFANQKFQKNSMPLVNSMPIVNAHPDGLPPSNFQPTVEQIAAMNPEQRMAYQQQAYNDYTKQQMGAFDEFGQAQNQMYDQREQVLEDKIAQTRQVEEEKNRQLVEAFRNEQELQGAEAKDAVMEAGAEGMDKLARNLARRGMARSTDADSAIQKATKNTQNLVAQIERETGAAVSKYQVELLDNVEKKVAALEDRVLNLGDQRAQAELGLLKERQKTYTELMSQSPSNPTKMIELADKLKTQQLAELKENNEAAQALRKDAQSNFQFMVGTFGSQYFQDMDDASIANLAANLNIPPEMIKNMGATLKEQENQWEKLKYFDSQDFEREIKEMEFNRADNRQLAQWNFEISKLSKQLQNEMTLEEFKSSLGDAKQDKVVQQRREALGLEYSRQSAGGDKSGLTFASPVPHPVSKDEVVALNSKIATAYPDGFRFKASDGVGGLGGQCKWFAQQLTTWPDGTKWYAGSTLAATKANFNKFYKEGKAFKVGEQEVKPGMSVLSSDSPTAGHGYVINSVRPDGKWIVTEANLKGPLTVSNNRVVDPNSPKIIGVLKTIPKPQYSMSANDLANTGASSAKEGLVLDDKQLGAIAAMSDSERSDIMKTDPELYNAFVNAGGSQKAQDVKKTRLPADKVVLLEDAKFLPGLLNDLEQTITSGKATFDPFWGNFNAVNPLNQYDTDQQTVNAELKRATQTIGKYMEGGVLRPDDEAKYRAMLPNATDTREVALNKLRGVRAMLEDKTKGYISGFDNAGYDVGQYVKDNPLLQSVVGKPATTDPKRADIKAKLQYGLNNGFTNQDMVNAMLRSEYAEDVKADLAQGYTPDEIIAYYNQ